METKQNKNNIPTMPKPEYCKCNKGHQLELVLNKSRTKYVWDCPICIESMRQENMANIEADNMEMTMENNLNNCLMGEE